jgi:hypothetical protein
MSWPLRVELSEETRAHRPGTTGREAGEAGEDHK